MAPIIPRPRQTLSTARFKEVFSGLRTQAYIDPATTRPGATPETCGIRCIAWNPLGSLVATGSIDNKLRVWNPDKPYVKFSTELKGHTATVEKVAFNPTKDAELCSVSSDGVVKFWDVRTKACFNEVKGLGDTFTLVWAPDGETLIVGNKDDKIFVLSPQQPQPLTSHQQPTQTNQIAFDWSGESVYVTTGDGKIRVLSYPGFEPLLKVPYANEKGEHEEFVMTGHTSSCLTVDLQPSAHYLASGGSDSVIALWNTEDWICHRTVTRLVGSVRSISFTFDGSYVVGGSDEGNGLDVIHVDSGDHVHTFKTLSASPVVAWAPTRYWLAYSDLGTLRIIGIDPDRK